MMSQIALLLLLSSQIASEPNLQPITDPLAPAREGKSYCQSPNREAKTCSGISTYRFEADGSIIGRSVGALNNDPPLSFAIEGVTEIKEGSICFTIRQKDLDAMYLMVGSERFDSEPGDKLLALRRESMATEILDKEICEKHYRDGDRLTYTTFVDSVENADMSGDYVLIDDSSGYRLHASTPLFEEDEEVMP
jgi:hypothetical protein